MKWLLDEVILPVTSNYYRKLRFLQKPNTLFYFYWHLHFHRVIFLLLLQCSLLLQKAIRYGIDFGRNGYGSIYVVGSGNGGSFQDNCNYDGYANSIYTVTIGNDFSTS